MGGDRQGVLGVDGDAEYQELAFGFATGVVAGVLAEFEPAPGVELPYTAGTPEAFGLGFMGFEAVGTQAFPAVVAVVIVFAGVVVDFGVRQVALVMEGAQAGAFGQGGLFVVEGADTDAGGLLLAYAAPLGEGVFGFGGGLTVEADDPGLDRGGGVHVVGDHQAVAVEAIFVATLTAFAVFAIPLPECSK